MATNKTSREKLLADLAEAIAEKCSPACDQAFNGLVFFGTTTTREFCGVSDAGLLVDQLVEIFWCLDTKSSWRPLIADYLDAVDTGEITAR